MDAAFVANILGLVAPVVSTELLKETTKDGYRQFKEAVGIVLGLHATRAIAKLERNPSSTEAKTEIETVFANASSEDCSSLQDAISALLAVLADDPAARKAAAGANIKLDIDSDANVYIRDVRGARNFDVKSKSVGNFEFSQIQMNQEPNPGK